MDISKISQWKKEPGTLMVLSYLNILVAEQGSYNVRVSQKKICDDTGLSRQSVRSAIKKILGGSNHEVTTSQPRGNHEGVVLNLSSLDSYVFLEQGEQPRGNHEPTTSQPRKEIETENERKEKDLLPPTTPIIEKENKEKEKDKEVVLTSILLTESTGSSETKNSVSDPAPEEDERERVDWGGLRRFFNEKMKNHAIPPIARITDRRRSNVTARIREFGKQAVVEVIKNAADSDFMNGKNERGWVADFDWMFRPNNFPKVLEGNYSNEIKQQSAYGDNIKDRRYLTRVEIAELESQQVRDQAERLLNKYLEENRRANEEISEDSGLCYRIQSGEAIDVVY